MSRVIRLPVRGIEIEVEEAGTGERAFVLVHGFTGSRDDFREHIPDLARLGRTLAPDLRGHGGTTNSGREDDYTFEGLVLDLAALFDALGLARADLLGHSLGGMVALRFTLAYPERVASLVLMDTSPRPLPAAFPAELRNAIARRAREHGVGALLAGMRRMRERSPAFPASARAAIARLGEDVYWERVRRKLEAMDPVAWDALSLALGDHDHVADRLGELRCPTLVMVGAEDAPFLTPADEMERAIPDAVRVTIPDAAHSPQLENPRAWSEAIHAHLRRARG